MQTCRASSTAQVPPPPGTSPPLKLAPGGGAGRGRSNRYLPRPQLAKTWKPTAHSSIEFEPIEDETHEQLGFVKVESVLIQCLEGWALCPNRALCELRLGELRLIEPPIAQGRRPCDHGPVHRCRSLGPRNPLCDPRLKHPKMGVRKGGRGLNFGHDTLNQCQVHGKNATPRQIGQCESSEIEHMPARLCHPVPCSGPSLEGAKRSCRRQHCKYERSALHRPLFPSSSQNVFAGSL